MLVYRFSGFPGARWLAGRARRGARLPLPAVVCLLAGVLLPGCATVPDKPAGESSEAAVSRDAGLADLIAGERPPITDLDPSLMYQILVGEVAGQRADLDTATRFYLAAAEDSDDVEVTKRALRIAMFGKQFPEAYRAARRWTELEPDNQDARKALAALALRVGRHDEAIHEFARILVEGNGGATSYDQVVAMLARDTDPGTALEMMQALVARVPPSAEAYLAYGKLAASAKQLDLALVNVEQALNLKPGWADAEILRARVLIGLGRGADALDKLDGALKKQPGDDTLRLAYARILVEQDKLKSARKEFERVARHDPDNVDVIFPLALLALQEEDYKAARAHFRHLLELGKRDDESYYYLGNIAAAEDRNAEAIEWYRKVAEGDYWLDAHTRVARIKVKQGELADARAELRSLRLKRPKLATRLAVIEGDLLMSAHEYQEAFDVYNQFMEQAPENTELVYGRALAAERLGQLELAEADLRALLEKDPDNVHALNALGYTLADRTSRYPEALELVSRAMELKPDDPAVIDSMGWVQYRLGNLREAIEYLRRAYGMTSDGEIGAHLGEVLWVSGDRKEARRIWKEALRKHPDNPVLRATVDRFLR